MQHMVGSFLLSYYLHHVQLPAQIQAESEGRGRGRLTVELRQSPLRSVQPGTQRVPMLTLRLTASCTEDVSLESVRAHRRGMGSSSDILALYVMQGSRRLVDGRQLSRSGFADLHLRDFTIPACGTEEFLLFADFAQDAAVAGEHWLTVEGAGDIVAAGAEVTLIRSGVPEKQRTAGGRVRGTIAVEYLHLLQTVRYGEDRTVSRIRLTADGQEDHLIHAITFTNEGSARDADLQGVFLRAGRNRRISAIAEQLDGERVRLTLDPPLPLRKNQTKLFELQADVRAGRRRTLQFIIEEPSDIETEAATRAE